MILHILIFLSILSAVTFCTYTWIIAGIKERNGEDNSEYLGLCCISACSIFMVIYVSAHSQETVSIIVCTAVISCLSILSKLFHKELKAINIQAQSTTKSSNLA